MKRYDKFIMIMWFMFIFTSTQNSIKPDKTYLIGSIAFGALIILDLISTGITFILEDDDEEGE